MSVDFPDFNMPIPDTTKYSEPNASSAFSRQAVQSVMFAASSFGSVWKSVVMLKLCFSALSCLRSVSVKMFMGFSILL